MTNHLCLFKMHKTLNSWMKKEYKMMKLNFL